MYCCCCPWMDKVVLSTSLLLFHVFLMGLEHMAPECHQLPWGQCPKPWISNTAPPQVPLRVSLPSRSSAWIQRRTGAALCVSQCVSMDRQRLVWPNPPFPGLPIFRPCGGKAGERVGSLSTNIPPSQRMESLLLWGFGPNPILGVTVKAKQCCLKSAWSGFPHKPYL